MKFLIYTAPIVACCSVTAQDTHYSLAEEIVDFLSQTEICLNLCQDEQSVKEMLPQLKELSAYAAELKARQSKLADLTPAEDKAIAKLIPDYLNLQRAIEEHVARIIKNGLMSEELAEVLCISPDYVLQDPPTTN